MSGAQLKPKWDQIRNKPADLVQESVAVDSLQFYDPELGTGEEVTLQILNGAVELSSTTIGIDSLVLTSAMQAAIDEISANIDGGAAATTYDSDAIDGGGAS
jgi:hypothetical protein